MWFLFLGSCFLLGLLFFVARFFAASVTSHPAGSLELKLGLGFWWLVWPLAQNEVFIWIGWWNTVMKREVRVVDSVGGKERIEEVHGWAAYSEFWWLVWSLVGNLCLRFRGWSQHWHSLWCNSDTLPVFTYLFWVEWPAPEHHLKWRQDIAVGQALGRKRWQWVESFRSELSIWFFIYSPLKQCITTAGSSPFTPPSHPALLLSPRSTSHFPFRKEQACQGHQLKT